MKTAVTRGVHGRAGDRPWLVLRGGCLRVGGHGEHFCVFLPFPLPLLILVWELIPKLLKTLPGRHVQWLSEVEGDLNSDDGIEVIVFGGEKWSLIK